MSPKQFDISCKALECAFADFIIKHCTAEDIDEVIELINTSAARMKEYASEQVPEYLATRRIVQVARNL